MEINKRQLNRLTKYMTTNIERFAKWETDEFIININEYLEKRGIILMANDYSEILKILNKKYGDNYKITSIEDYSQYRFLFTRI